MNNKIKFLKNIKPTFDITTLKFKTNELELNTEYHSYNKQFKNIDNHEKLIKVFHENMPEEIIKYIKLMGFEKNQYTSNINIQVPGQFISLHKDGHLNARKVFNLETTDFRRFLVFLTDWHMGEVFCVEEECVTDWKAGDWYTFDSINKWHYGVNAGHVNKYTLLLSVINKFIPKKIL